MRRLLPAATPALLAAVLVAVACVAPGADPAAAEPKPATPVIAAPGSGTAGPVAKPGKVDPVPSPPNAPDSGEDEEGGDEDVVKQQPYERIVEMLLYHMPQDTVGTADFAKALRACEEGRYDEGMQQLRLFTQQYPRNLLVNEALETILLVRGNREFKDEPLRLYLAAQLARRTGKADSAAVLAREGLSRYPGARLRHHWSYMLAEMARDRGDHAGSIAFALAVADTVAKSRLAPYALRLAAEETLAIGQEPSRALRYYQELLERFPDSPLAPEVRARALVLRKKLQL